MAYCLLSFGSNLGEPRELVARAARLLCADPGLSQPRFSRLFATPPIGGPAGQGPFVNATAVVQTQYRAREVLRLLQTIETQLGRVREQRWDARSIDLDLVLYGDWIGRDLQLTLPHPRLVARSFVLQPALDVAPEWREPRSGWTLSELAAHLQEAPPSFAMTGGNQLLRQSIGDHLAAAGLVVLRRGPMDVSHTAMAKGMAPMFQPLPDDRPEQLPSPPRDRPWVSDFVPTWPPQDRLLAPRAIARLHSISHDAWWPEPRRIWRNGWQWPEYQLDAVDPAAAAREVLAAIDAMCCPVEPISENGDWGLP